MCDNHIVALRGAATGVLRGVSVAPLHTAQNESGRFSCKPRYQCLNADVGVENNLLSEFLIGGFSLWLAKKRGMGFGVWRLGWARHSDGAPNSDSACSSQKARLTHAQGAKDAKADGNFEFNGIANIHAHPRRLRNG